MEILAPLIATMIPLGPTPLPSPGMAQQCMLSIIRTVTTIMVTSESKIVAIALPPTIMFRGLKFRGVGLLPPVGVGPGPGNLNLMLPLLIILPLAVGVSVLNR